MRAVMLSIKPKYCELIANGEKTVEVRKTKPKLDTPFKCYIYETKGLYRGFDGRSFSGRGKVIGEFICDEIKKGILSITEYVDSVNIGSDETCLSIDEIKGYLGMRYTQIKGRHDFCGWHISNLVIYDEPRELRDFRKHIPFFDGITTEELEEEGVNGIRLTKPPQSWCYVEEMESEEE